MSIEPCTHPTIGLTRHRLPQGGVQFSDRCLTCWRTFARDGRTFIPRAALAPEEVEDAIEYDPERADAYWRQHREAVVARADSAREQRSAAWWAEYERYMSSPEWRTRRARVLNRADGLCEGCRLARAVEVHHLSYAHFGAELLWELAAVCHACHERAHGREIPNLSASRA